MTYIGCHLDVPGRRKSQNYIRLREGGEFNGGQWHRGGNTLKSTRNSELSPLGHAKSTSVNLTHQRDFMSSRSILHSCNSSIIMLVSYKTAELLWPVVQNLVSANPRQKLNSFSFCTSTYKSTLKLLGTKTTVDPDRICEEIFPSLSTSLWEISFQDYVNPG